MERLKAFIWGSFFLHYGWFLQNLEKGFIPTNMHATVSAISMEKAFKNHRETQYFSKGKIVYAVGKPCTIYRLWEKLYDNYRISLQPVNSTGFPYTIHNLSFLGVWGFSANLTALFRRYCWKNLRNPVQPCKPVKCRVSSVMTCWVLAKKLAS